MFQLLYLIIFIIIGSTVGLRINFTNCQYPEWTCADNLPNDIVYTCSVTRSNEHIIHLKDYYTDFITSVTVQNCRELKVVLDCPILQKTSHLQRFTIKNAEKLEFVSLSTGSLLQTPPEVTIENVDEIVALPKNIFKSPTSTNERKCLGTNSLKRIRIANSMINTIKTKALYNVTGIRSIEFENVTINNLQSQAIEAIMSSDSVFTIINSSIDNIGFKGITVQASTVNLSANNFTDITKNSVNITSDNLLITANAFRQIHASGLILKSANTDIQRNNIITLKSNAFNNIKCVRRRASKKGFNFSFNNVQNVEPLSLIFDHSSCKLSGTAVTFTNNKIDCRCRNIAFLNYAAEPQTVIINPANNNTCISAPCDLPVDVVKVLIESNMCWQNLDLQLMCLIYHDNKNEVTSYEDVTLPPPTLYLIRPANSPNSVAAMTAINKDDLLRDSKLNVTNRVAIKVVFDSSKDFVETLRGTANSRKRTDDTKPLPKEDYVNRCVGPHCRNNVAYDRQKALDFYKYVYAQLRTPNQSDTEKKKT